MHDTMELSTCAAREKAIRRRSFAPEEEHNLLARARAGDVPAFERLVMPHRNAMMRLTQRILRNREDAEDAVQTALFDAFRHLNSFQGRSRFSSWLTRIAMNAAFMRLRSTSRKAVASLDEIVERRTTLQFEVVDGRANPEQECSVKEARALLAKALDRLGPLYRDVLHMFHLQELPAREAARILGVPVGTVKARLHRARCKLARNVRSILDQRRTSGRRSAGATNAASSITFTRTSKAERF